MWLRRDPERRPLEALQIAPMNDPAGLAVGGDIDEDTYPALVRKLAQFALGRDEVHVDLSAVEFCDLAGLRALVQLATPQRSVVLYGLPAHLQTLLGVVGWDCTPGLTIANRALEVRPA